MKELNTMTTKELKEMAKNLKISNWWNLKKEILIAKIEEVQNMSTEETEERNEEIKKENELFEHYSKHWRKYGPTNNWSKFKKAYEAGKIELVEDEEIMNEEKTEELGEVMTEDDKLPEAIEENIESIEENTEPIKLTPKRGVLIEFDGKAQNICAWGKELNISPNTLYGRIYKMNWSVEKAFTTPARKGGKK